MTQLPGDLENLKQEILREIKKEFSRMKQEIIDGMYAQSVKRGIYNQRCVMCFYTASRTYVMRDCGKCNGYNALRIFNLIKPASYASESYEIIT